MNDKRRRKLPEVLRRHVQGGALNAAFVEAQRRTGISFDRSTLARWKAGTTTPGNGHFVRVLGEVLEDPEVLAAWEADARTPDPEVQGVLTRFQRLEPRVRRAAVEAALRDLFATDKRSRSDLTMTIRLQLHAADACDRLDVTITWTGYLPAQAVVQIASTDVELADAYDQDRCIFRELIPLESAPFELAMEAFQVVGESTPVLRYRPEGNRRFRRLEAEPQDEPGRYQFANEEVARADIRLTVCFPYPSDLCVYPVKFGGYALHGVSTSSLVLEGSRSSRLHAIPFEGTGPVNVHPHDFGQNEVAIEIGEEGSLLPPGAGVVFFWRADDARLN